jgi:condensin complex subunit 1
MRPCSVCHKRTFIILLFSEMASIFFTELSQKGNTLYNVMPDIISRLSTPDLNLDEEKFKTIMK